MPVGFLFCFSEIISLFFVCFYISLWGTLQTIKKFSKYLECAECALFLKPAALGCSRLGGIKYTRGNFWNYGFCIGKVVDTVEENIFDSLRPQPISCLKK